MYLLYEGCTHWGKRFSVINTEHNKYSLTVTVVTLGDSFVLILSCSVPYLQFNPDWVNGDDFEYKINADGHHVVVYELALVIA